MQIKTNDGNYDVASKGLGNTALGLGIAGLATSLLGGRPRFWASEETTA